MKKFELDNEYEGITIEPHDSEEPGLDVTVWTTCETSTTSLIVPEIVALRDWLNKFITEKVQK